MRKAIFLLLLAVAMILLLTACGRAETGRQPEPSGGPTFVTPTFLPLTASPTPPSLMAPTQPPQPSAMPTPPPLPSREQSMLQFEQSIVPLLDQGRSLPPAPADFNLPPLEEMQIVLVPANEYLYFIQNILYPDSLTKTPDGKPTLYLIYSYARGQTLSNALSPFTAATQEVIVQVYPVVQMDGQEYILEETNGVGGEGTQNDREMLTKALGDLTLWKFLGTYSNDVRDQLQALIGFATGIIWPPDISQSQQLALLERILESENWSDRDKAATILDNMGSTESLPALIAALKFRGGSVQSRLLEAINQLKPGTIDPEQIENPDYLSGALTSPEWETRAIAAMFLGIPSWERDWEIGPVLPGLQALLLDPKPEVRAAAAWALGENGVEAAAAVPDLINALGDEQEMVRENAAAALAVSQDNPGQAVPALISALQDKDYQVRTNAARVLGYFGPASAEAVPSLEQALGDDFIAVRYLAAETLGKIGPAAKAALPRLLEAIAADESPAVRIEALQAVPLIAPDSAETITTLAQALNDPHSSVRSVALQELTMIAPDSAETLSALVQGLSDPNSKVRTTAAWHLDTLGEMAIDAVPALITALQDADENVREAALQALKDITGQDFPPDPGAWQKWWEGQ